MLPVSVSTFSLQAWTSKKIQHHVQNWNFIITSELKPFQRYDSTVSECGCSAFILLESNLPPSYVIESHLMSLQPVLSGVCVCLFTFLVWETSFWHSEFHRLYTVLCFEWDLWLYFVIDLCATSFTWFGQEAGLRAIILFDRKVVWEYSNMYLFLY